MESFKNIDINSAISKIQKNHFLIVDIRDKESFKLGHINGAVNLSNSSIDNFILNTKKDESILIYCYHGNSSQGAAKFFVSCGFNDVSSLQGGYEAWKINKNT